MAAPGKPAPVGKKSKLYNSRTIRAEVADPSFKNGSLNIPEFISSREYEIKAFEQSQLNTKAASSTRIFQSLPRTLRRRTASHNVKRIPKRLREKAKREMQNSTSGTPAKKAHLRGRELHRLKMQKRLLRVASKIKESRGVPSAAGSVVKDKIKSLNEQLAALKKAKKSPLNNAVAAFDRCSVNTLMSKPSGNLKYGSRQKTYTWTPTHVWHAKRFHMIKRWGFQIPFSPNQKCFRSTSRAAREGTVAFESSYYSELVVKCLNADGVNRFLQAFSRYCDTIPEWLSSGKRAYNGWIYLDEQKLAPGTVLVDALSHRALVRLHPSVYERFFSAVVKWTNGEFEVVDCRYAIGSIELRGPSALNSLSQVLHVEASEQIKDHWWTVSQHRDPCMVPTGTRFSFFVRDPRFWKNPTRAPLGKGVLTAELLKEHAASDPNAVKALFSLKARTDSYKDMYSIKQLGQEFARRDPMSPHIHAPNKFPVTIYKTAQGSWCVLMPWFWVQPLWSKLITVSGVKPAGLRQIHQLNFESNIPTFPQDYPQLPDGYKEHIMVCAAARLAREKLPASKQVPVKTTEGPLTPDADWFFLRKWIVGLNYVEDRKAQIVHNFGSFDESKIRELKTPNDLALVINATRENDTDRIPITAYNKRDCTHTGFANGTFVPDIYSFPPMPVVLVSITLSEKGSIADNARIYHRVANPSLKDLIGFVTSGAFNFSVGHPTAIGLVSADNHSFEKVLIRNVGCTTYSKAKMSLT